MPLPTAKAIWCVCLLLMSPLVLGQTTASQLPQLRLSVAPDHAGSASLDDALARVTAARQALRLHPDSASDYVSLGLALKLTGENEAASRAFQRARELGPNLAEPWYQEGLTEADRGDWSRAAENFRRAAELDPKNVLARLELGEMLLRAGDFEQASTELMLVSHLDAGNSGAHYGLGLVRLQQGDLATAEGEFRRAISLRPEFFPARESLGETLVREHKWREAVAILDALVASNPESLNATNALATALANSGDRQRAEQEFQKAREIARQENATALATGENNRGLELWYGGKLPEAAGAFRSAIAANPGYAEAHNNLGGVLWQMDDRSSAVAEFEAAVRCRPDFAQAHNNWGSALVHAGQIDRALEEFRAALKYQPGFALAHLNLGKALTARHEAVAAETEFRRAVALVPEMAAAHIQLGLLLISKDGSHTEEARAELKEGLRLDPKLGTSIPPQYARELQ